MRHPSTVLMCLLASLATAPAQGDANGAKAVPTLRPYFSGVPFLTVSGTDNAQLRALMLPIERPLPAPRWQIEYPRRYRYELRPLKYRLSR